MPELSVVVPVYNTGRILKYSIAEILGQSYSDFELILVDDGSTDGSGSICDAFADRDHRISVIHKSNGGAGSARNAGIEKASGTFIIFPDADDFCKPDMFRMMMRTAHKGDVDLVICSYENVKVDGEGNRSDIQTQKLFDVAADSPEAARELWFKLRRINISLLNTPWNKIYKKSIIDQYRIRFPDIRRAQDAVFNLYYYDHISSVTVIGDSLYQYNANDAVRTGKKFPKDAYKCFIEYNRVMEQIINGWGMYDGEYKALCDNNLLGNIDSCVELCNNPVWNLTSREKIEYLNHLMSDQYLRDRLIHYSGDVPEIEDIVTPLIEGNAKRVLNMLNRRSRIDRIRRSVLGKGMRKLKLLIPKHESP